MIGQTAGQSWDFLFSTNPFTGFGNLAYAAQGLGGGLAYQVSDLDLGGGNHALRFTLTNAQVPELDAGSGTGALGLLLGALGLLRERNRRRPAARG